MVTDRNGKAVNFCMVQYRRVHGATLVFRVFLPGNTWQATGRTANDLVAFELTTWGVAVVVVASLAGGHNQGCYVRSGRGVRGRLKPGELD